VSRHGLCPVHREGTEAAWPPSVAAFLNRGAAPAEAESAGSLRILSPARGCTYRHVPDLDVDAQRLALDAATDRAGDPLHWFVDDRPVGRSRVGQPLFWPIERGQHRIVCSTLGGASDCVRITVE